MTYHSVRARKSSKHPRIIALVVVVAILSYFWGSIREHLYPVALPVISSYSATRDGGGGILSGIHSFFTSRNEYEKRIAALSENIERLENQLQEAQAGVGRVEIGTSTQKFTVSMYPVVRDSTHMYNSVLVSKGFVDGLEEGDLVYVRGRQAVGRIATVHKTTATMTLFSAPGEKVEGVIPEIDGAFTLLGQGGGFYLIEAPKGSELLENQVVYFAADQSMKLGTIVQVKNDPQDVFIRAYVVSPYNPTKAHIYYVDK